MLPMGMGMEVAIERVRRVPMVVEETRRMPTGTKVGMGMVIRMEEMGMIMGRIITTTMGEIRMEETTIIRTATITTATTRIKIADRLVGTRRCLRRGRMGG
jgi:hypothetical protein